MITKEQRYWNRQQALKHIAKVEAVADDVRVRDQFGQHITVKVGNTVVQWWPGSGKWSDGTQGPKATHCGDMVDFLAYLRNLPWAQRAADDFRVVE